MSIIFCMLGKSHEKQTVEALELLGQTVICFNEEIGDINYNADYMNKLIDFCEIHKPYMVWSMDFLPIVSRTCHYLHVPYISWVTEKNVYTLYSNTVAYRENFIFVAEESIFERVKGRNEGQIFYIMPGGLVREKEQENGVFLHLPEESKGKYWIKENPSEYLIGYLRGAIEVQLKIYGSYFIRKILTEDIKKEFSENISRKDLGKDYEEGPLEYLMDDFLCDTITAEEKDRIRGKINADVVVEGDNERVGTININIANRNWKKGVPFEVFSIMGAGGFLISNYQENLETYFEIGKELIVFEDYEDLERKIIYYQEHEEERKEIARNGQKAVERYLLTERIKDIFYLILQK